MPTTPNFALPYPNEGDPADVPVDMQKLAAQVDTELGLMIPKAAAGVAGGVATLDSGGHVPASQLNLPAPPTPSVMEEAPFFNRVGGNGNIGNSATVTVMAPFALGAAGDYIIQWGAELFHNAQGGSVTAKLYRSGSGGAQIDTTNAGNPGGGARAKAVKVTLAAGETLRIDATNNSSGYAGGCTEVWVLAKRVA